MIHYQGYTKLTDNILKKGNLILKSKPESKRGSIQTTQIAEPYQGKNLH